MYLANLKRFGEFYDATLGVLRVGDKKFFTLEDKWLNNKPSESCIPAGDYTCVPHGWNGELVRFKKVWEVQYVPGRKAILIHEGNWHTSTTGCILIGMGLTVSKNGAMITNSREALDELRKLVGSANFRLTIE